MDVAAISERDAVEAMRTAWTSVVGAGRESVADDLVERYAEPHRRYHTAVHIAFVLRNVDAVLDAEPDVAPFVDRGAVIAAALFHDAIYATDSSTNEFDSAALAARALGAAAWDEERVASVVSLIEATAQHSASTLAEAVLLDADLAVLSSAPDSYRAYVVAIREEYGLVPDAQWRVGRAGVLQGFLDRDRLFATAFMRSRCEQQALANLRAELSGLAAGVATGE